jgi:hypothetical protein
VVLFLQLPEQRVQAVNLLINLRLDQRCFVLLGRSRVLEILEDLPVACSGIELAANNGFQNLRLFVFQFRDVPLDY